MDDERIVQRKRSDRPRSIFYYLFILALLAGVAYVVMKLLKIPIPFLE